MYSNDQNTHFLPQKKDHSGKHKSLIYIIISHTSLTITSFSFYEQSFFFGSFMAKQFGRVFKAQMR